MKECPSEKMRKMIVKMDDLGLLDTIEGLLEPEIIGRISELLINKGTMRIIDNIDKLLEELGDVDFEKIENLVPIVNKALGGLEREPKPVGFWGLLGALRDPKVKKGVGILIEILRALGEAEKTS